MPRKSIRGDGNISCGGGYLKGGLKKKEKLWGASSSPGDRTTHHIPGKGKGKKKEGKVGVYILHDYWSQEQPSFPMTNLILNSSNAPKRQRRGCNLRLVNAQKRGSEETNGKKPCPRAI